MNSTMVTAMAAALGSLLGTSASIATTWMTQRTQAIRAHSEWKLRERESLYKEFITEASRLTFDALAHSLERMDQPYVSLRDSKLHSTHVRGRGCAPGRSLLLSDHPTLRATQFDDGSHPHGRRGPGLR